ncbi:MAG: histidine kinase [Chitinophagaceae bacterium]|nr:histidine kinase [Chitinophagaceae bacterium]
MRSGNTRYWLLQFIGWGSFALINILFAFSFDKLETFADRRLVFGRLGIFVILGLILSHIMRMVIIRVNVLQRKLEKQLVFFILITLFFSLIGSYFDMMLLQHYDFLNKNEKEFLGNMVLLVISGAFYFFIYFFIWNLIYFVYHYISKSRKQQLDTLQLESLVKELELKTIKAHINPHFIFNSLNSIRALVDENPERARRAITELSNILRSSMQADKSETVTLEKELFIVKDYLALENMRFEDRLRIEYDIDEDTLDQPVPPMMLQTLVENAIKHGISKQINGGVVRVISVFKGDFHELSVQNTGYLNGANGAANKETKTDDPIGKGFGLSSTTDRLSLLYGNKAKFEIKQSTSTLVEAKVLIPFENEIR